MKKFGLLLLTLAWSSQIHAADPVKSAAKPNIVLILADDMGYSDLGCYGSEIPTPNLDALAAEGLRLTQFHNTARCSPSRAALLTGLNPHQAGMGRLAEEAIRPQQPDKTGGYMGYLNDHCVTLAEVLKGAGYHTYMAGKWHLGMHNRECWPLQHGFDRYFGILAGATSYFRPTGMRGLTLDNEQLPTTTDTNFYTTDAFADFAIKTVTEQKDKAPFFLYLAFNAPHWPLQARPEDIAKFVGKYRAGWDKLREQRHARQIQMGLLSPDWPLSPRDDGARAWDSLSEEEKTNLDYRMAVYAAQVYRLDLNVGRLVAALRASGKLDNTLLVFLSDNGACNEPFTDLGGGEQSKINDPSVMSAVSYGTGWANLSDTPLRKFKQNLREGGIAAPFIVHWPAGLKTPAGSIETNRVGYLTDIMPTFLDVSGATYPKERNGKIVTPFEGCSLLPVLRGTNASVASHYFCWEQYGNKAVRQGDWKAVFCMKGGANGTATSGRWELYNLAQDRTELHDVAAEQPEELKKLVAQWDAWAARSQVLPTPGPAAGAKKNPAKPKTATPADK